MSKRDLFPANAHAFFFLRMPVQTRASAHKSLIPFCSKACKRSKPLEADSQFIPLYSYDKVVIL
jgi:hypothetical protein